VQSHVNESHGSEQVDLEFSDNDDDDNNNKTLQRQHNNFIEHG